MISADQLADFLNKEVDKNFIDTVKELWDDEDYPFDPEHPDMETILEKVCDKINELFTDLDFDDEY